MDWFVNTLLAGKRNPLGSGNPRTYDGAPARMTFYVMGKLERDGTDIRDALRNAYLRGHEIGNHGYWDSDYGLTAAAWRESIA